MIGITSCGAYIPLHRLSKAEIARAWGGAPAKGEKAVANFDEDSLTMAVAACRDCVSGEDTKAIDSIYFASTTFPYKEKQSASVIATAVDTSPEAFTADISNSMRSGATAVKMAMDAVKGGSSKKAMVCAADIRLAYPNSMKEMEFGDGAGAFTIGEDDVIACIEGVYTEYSEMLDLYRAQDDVYVRSSEERFVRDEGYTRVTVSAVTNALKRCNAKPEDFKRFVCNVPNASLLSGIAKKCGFDPKTQVSSVLLGGVGNTGAAYSMMLLVEALEESEPGDKICWATYGDGCDVYMLAVTDKIAKIKNKRGIKKHLESKRVLPTYEKYLRWRDILVTEPPSRPPLERPSAVALWRDNEGLALYGVKCNNCGTPQYPRQRVCMRCHAKDNFSPYRFANMTGTISTYSQDNLAASVDPPSTVCAVDFPGGGRIMIDMTDRDPQAVKVGMPVEMTFRLVRNIASVHDYWWKAMPLRTE